MKEFELQSYSVFRVGTKLGALWGNYHGLLFSSLLYIYQIGRDTQRPSSGSVYAITAVTHQQEVPLKARVMIIKRKREIRIKLEREQYQECKSRKNSRLVAFPCSKCMRNLKFCLTCLWSTHILTFKCCFSSSTPTVLHIQSKMLQCREINSLLTCLHTVLMGI